jgi:hypothetical protein
MVSLEIPCLFSLASIVITGIRFNYGKNVASNDSGLSPRDNPTRKSKSERPSFVFSLFFYLCTC